MLPAGIPKPVYLKRPMYVKICGITQPEQAEAIANLGSQALGFIGVPNTPRYLAPERMIELVGSLQVECERIGVFQDQDPQLIISVASKAGLTGIQLHGQESVTVCAELRAALPEIRLIKAIRLRDPGDLAAVSIYGERVDAFLIDAYDPQRAGGTGQTVDWRLLRDFHCPQPWLLAGGIRPENVAQALQESSPDGIDLSSGVESSPGIKDLQKVRQLFAILDQVYPQGHKQECH